jgi:hypothetical protein
MAEPISAINKALNLVPRRADQRQADELRDTFVDSGISVALEGVDHQVLYGRKGTGKTHALRFLETEIRARGDIVFYADLRTIGSPEGLFAEEVVPSTERAARLLVDLLTQLHDALTEAAVEDEELIMDGSFLDRLDALAEAIGTIRVVGEVQVEQEDERTQAEEQHTGASLTAGMHLVSRSKLAIAPRPASGKRRARCATESNGSASTSRTLPERFENSPM